MKSYSSVFAFIGIMALVIIPVYHINSGEQDYLDIVTKSFQVTKADFNELNMEAWAQIKKKGLSLKELNAVYKVITTSLKINNNPIINDDYDDFISIYQKEQINDGTTIEISLQSFLSEGTEAGTFLGIQVNSNDFETSRKFYHILSQLVSQLNAKTDIGITFIGTYPGQLSEDEIYKKIAQGFAAVNARVVEGINTRNLISFSGYTPQCSQYLEVGGKRININMASRYHFLDNKTYIHVGAPLIYQEY